MPEPLSTTIGICWIGYAAMHAPLRGRSAISSEAQMVNKALISLVGQAEQSHALFGEKAAAISQLHTMAAECASANWNAEDACAINPLALFYAENFIRALPQSIPLPEFAPEPDGSVSLDWIPSQNRLFSVSVGANNRLAFAWLDGSDKGHAVACFDGDRIPQRILDNLTEIVNNGNTILRAA
jgi:hypothetical protein